MKPDSKIHVPPNSLDTETAIVGLALTADADAVLATGLQASDFYDPALQTIFSTIATLHSEGIPVDAVSVGERLEESGTLAETGGFERFHQILMHGSDWQTQIAHIEHYAAIVRGDHILRELARFGSELARQAYVPGTDADALLAEAAQKIQAFEGVASSGLIDLRESVSQVLDEIRERMENPNARRVMTGLRDLDKMLGGLRPGQLIVPAARTGIGKTAFALNIASNVMMAGTPVLFASFEMTHQELTERFLAGETGLNLHDISTGNVTPEQMRILQAVKQRVLANRMFYTSGQSHIDRVIQAARQAIRKHKVGLVIADYLQLIEANTGRSGTREQAVSAVSRGLKRLAMENAVPVVALAQLNRDVEKREDKRPRLADLRESGAIEQDANVVMFLHRPDAYDAEDRPGIAEIIISKNRQGPTGVVSLTFRRECSRFENFVQAFEDIDIPEDF